MSQIESGRSCPVACDLVWPFEGGVVPTVVFLVAGVVVTCNFDDGFDVTIFCSDSFMAFASSTIEAGTSPVWTVLTSTSVAKARFFLLLDEVCW